MTTKQYNLYSYWASYLANNDDSGISKEDKAAADEFLRAEKLSSWTVVDISEQWFGFPDYGNLAGDVAKYTFMRD